MGVDTSGVKNTILLNIEGWIALYLFGQAQALSGFFILIIDTNCEISTFIFYNNN